MSAKRPDNQQLKLAFEVEAAGEPRQGHPQEVEADMAAGATEHPVIATDKLMEAICSVKNIATALQRVKSGGWRSPSPTAGCASLASRRSWTA